MDAPAYRYFGDDLGPVRALCTCCLELKPQEEFTRSSKSASGRAPTCRECSARKVREGRGRGVRDLRKDAAYRAVTAFLKDHPDALADLVARHRLRFEPYWAKEQARVEEALARRDQQYVTIECARCHREVPKLRYVVAQRRRMAGEGAPFFCSKRCASRGRLVRRRTPEEVASQPRDRRGRFLPVREEEEGAA